VESVYLRTLVEVVKAGSLSRAAEILCVTQPAVSRRIKFLEERYGRALLDRSGSQVRPTEAGRLVVQKAEALLEIEADLDACLHRLEGKTRLTFGCTQAFGIAHLPKVLKNFMLTCGETAELKFMFLPPRELLQGMGEGMFDGAVLEGATLLDPAFTSYPLPEAEIIFFSAPSLGLPSPQTTIEALLERPLFTRLEGCCSRMLLEKGLKDLGHDLGAFRKVIILDDLHLLIQTVLEGEGVSFLPRDLLRDHLAAGRANVHIVPGLQHACQRALVVNQGEGAPAPMTQLIEVVLEHFRCWSGQDHQVPLPKQA
jgi:DNA-binding transcriptional LysR family regulator